MSFSKIVLNGETLTRENFMNPPKEMGILPFWFWNGEMEEKEMEWQLKEYYDRGVRGLFIHGRFGESIGYLSDTWFERVKFAVRKGKEIGLELWVYDEMNWPSGTAYRKVPQDNKKLRQKYLEMVVLDVYGPLFTFLEASDDRYINTGNSKPIAAYAVSNEEYENGIKEVIDLTPNLSFDVVVPWEAPAGHWKLLYFLEKEIDYYIDALNPASTAKFIEETHEKYKHAVGEEFGKTVPGFYTDEPAMHYYHVGMNNFIIPWTSQMFKIFREKRGYDLKPLLPALYADMGERTAHIRYDFWRTLTEQYSEAYYSQIRQWCEKNNVIFTGHLLGEEWLRMHARCEGNIFKHLKHMHLTGVDHLYPIIGTEKSPDQHVALKIASSAAHFYGSARLLCESMGGTYWDCSLERMKWIANWELALGVTIFNNHGYHYSIEGERKRDWPPSQFYHHTWWKYYDIFTDYMARLGHILSGGKHVAKVLLLYPINTIWTNYTPQKNNPYSDLSEKDFVYLNDALLRLHYDFDVADEDIISEAEVQDGQIIIKDEAYSLIILPPLTHIKAKALKKLREFTERGGKLIAEGLLPVSLLEENGTEGIKDLFGADPADVCKNYANKTFRVIENGNCFFIETRGLAAENKLAELDELIKKCIKPDVIISEGDVFYLHRQKDGFDIYFLTNTAQEEKGRVEISFEKEGVPELWNPVTGEMEEIYVYEYKNGRLYLTLEFGPVQSYVVVIKDEKKEAPATSSNMNVMYAGKNKIKGYMTDDNQPGLVIDGRIITLDKKESLEDLVLEGEWKFSIESDNTLCIPAWKMQMTNGEDTSEYTSPLYSDMKWLNVTMGAWEMQLPQERDEDVYPVTLWYRAKFEAEYIPERLVLLIDGFSGSEYELYLNSKQLNGKEKRSRFDAEIKEVDISKSAVEGENLIALKLTVSKRTDGVLDMFKIAGDFELRPALDNYVIVKPSGTIKASDWTEQGYPFYSGTGVYEKNIVIPEEYMGHKLFLETENGEDVLEISAAGKNKIIPWSPYKVDVTDMVKPGNNKLTLKITNTLINMLEGKTQSSGLLSEPKIKAYPVYEYNK